jgi:DNA-binding MarR family transcriptional regulator
MSIGKSLAEARELSQLMIDAADLSKDVFSNIAQELNIPVSLARAICLLETPAPMTELAARLACDKSYITPLADQMESLGLINRVPGADRRTKLLELTPKGKAVRKSLGEKVAEFSPVMVALNSAERATFMKLLAKIVKP